VVSGFFCCDHLQKITTVGAVWCSELYIRKRHVSKKFRSTFETWENKQQIAIYWLETVSHVTSFKITGVCPGNLHFTHVASHLPFSKKVVRARSLFLHIVSLEMVCVLSRGVPKNLQPPATSKLSPMWIS
jgi:hypothetical protein